MPVLGVDGELKKKMNKYRYVNWSEILRTEIDKIIGKLESRNLAEALLINEKLRKKIDNRYRDNPRMEEKEIWRKW